ncbi:MAG TPA: nucleotidyltransferase domain-containing protein [Candidatus Nanoarchaeia archaeon]|nr:nucleotidyltransferase domain-containing protein [Candidatus Nanoarchaeia archaeon]
MVDNINNTKIDIISLYRNKYLGQFHARQIARLIGKSHVGIAPHLKEFEKDKILIPEEIGKSKVYSLNLHNNKGREYLSFAEKKESLELLNKEIFIKKLYDECINIEVNGCLILFGSYASKKNTEKSDIDLLYLGDLEDSEIKKIRELGKAYDKEIHLVSMSIKQFREQLSKQGALVKETVNNHIILYNHDIFINEVWRYYNERKER